MISNLYYIVLFCIVLYCVVLYCIVLCCIVLYRRVLYCIVLHCIVLYCIVLYCIVLYCIVLYCDVLYCIVLYCIALYRAQHQLSCDSIIVQFEPCNFAFDELLYALVFLTGVNRIYHFGEKDKSIKQFVESKVTGFELNDDGVTGKLVLSTVDGSPKKDLKAHNEAMQCRHLSPSSPVLS